MPRSAWKKADATEKSYLNLFATMKKFLAAAAALTAITLTPPARAYVSEANIGYTKAIIQKLRDKGVTITQPTICPDGMAGKYDFTTATLMLCPAAMSNEALLVETVAHEATHAAQHCVQGPLVTNVREERMDDYVKHVALAVSNKWTHVNNETKHLSEEQKAMEYEAYAFEASPVTVLSILNKVCR
jgi:hypothetical protein